MSYNMWAEEKKKLIKLYVPNGDECNASRKVAEELKEKISGIVSKEHIDVVEIAIVGSIARGTYIKTKTPDIDIFLLFKDTVNLENIKEEGLKIGKIAINGETRYAQHPYIHGFYKNFEVDIVPAYKIMDPSIMKMSAVDRTPFHNAFVLNKMNERMRIDTVILKQFLYAHDIYGAEAKISGLSGYLTELLIIYYNTFENLIKHVAKWKPPVKLSLTGDGHYNGFTEPMIYIDPVDSSRNVAAALSIDCLSKFITLARRFNDNPSEQFLFKKEVKIASKEELIHKLKERGTEILVIETKAPEVVDDILYPQLKRFVKVVIDSLERYGFKVVNGVYDLVNSRIVILIELYSLSLPALELRNGPPAWNDNSNEFLNKWLNSKRSLSYPFIMDGYWWVYVRREFNTAMDLVKDRLQTWNPGKNITEILSEGFSVKKIDDSAEDSLMPPLTKLMKLEEPDWLTFKGGESLQ
ncbi:MAG: CCA tRNA nucleotidyltransferase [Candidatus Thermoplasmatota archaeon]|nr:CCA tRNA nucleotidyltransferase [Candidatus Thermoplasmatota archaeon]MCL5962960.1 CCA tRNA nucleotidyltransferase [Candidatus Thermoplasmatota archaeon]